MSVAGFDSQRATARQTPWPFWRLGLWSVSAAAMVLTYLAFAVWLPYWQMQATVAEIAHVGGDVKTLRIDPWERQLMLRFGYDSGVFERVSSVDLANTSLSDADLGRLPALATVRLLSLAGTGISDGALPRLSNSRDLTLLDLRDTRISSAGLSHLAPLDRLTQLDLSGTNIGDSAMIHLKALTALKHLSLTETKITPAAFDDISQIELCTLDLDAAVFTRQTVADLQKIATLYGLGLYSQRDGDGALPQLHELRGVTHLHLVGPGFTDAGIPHLETLRGAKEIRLEGTAISAAGIERLQQLLPECLVEQVAR